MSADIMLICEGRNENYKTNFEKCFFIGDTGKLSDCAILIQNKIGMVDENLINEIIDVYKRNPTDDFNIESLVSWLKERIGKYIETEAW